MLRSPLGITAGRLLVVLALVGAWELASERLVPRFFISSPSHVLRVLGGWIADGSLWGHLGTTLLETALGYALGAAGGIVGGLVLGFLRRVERVVAPFLMALYCLPKIALAPLFVILLGIELPSKVALVAVTVFFLLLYSTLDGARDVDPDLVQALTLMGATRGELTRRVLLPSTLPWIFTGLRVSVRYAFTAAILGELIASNQGIGFLIEASAGNYNATGVFAAVLLLVICSVLLTEGLARTEASALRWRL